MSEKRKREDEEEAESRPSKSVHHFCTATTEYQLPEQFVNIGRKYHTPSRFEFAMPDQRYRVIFYYFLMIPFMLYIELYIKHSEIVFCIHLL